jgi:hypothetical protein
LRSKKPEEGYRIHPLNGKTDIIVAAYSKVRCKSLYIRKVEII